MNIQLTERDLSLMRWINGLGFVDIEHVIKKLGINKSTAYTRLKKLVSEKYLIYERIFHGRNGVYRVTNKGVRVSDDKLSALRKINLAKYEHDLIVVNVSLFLSCKYSSDAFITERRIRHSQGIIGVGNKGHICDGMLVTKDQKIALEIELSSKGRARRESIIKYYTKKFEYDEIWYLCKSDNIKRQILPLVKNRPFIKVLDLNSFGHIE